MGVTICVDYKITARTYAGWRERTSKKEVCLRGVMVKAMDSGIALLRSLSGKYPWGRYEPPYPPSYGLNSTTTVIGPAVRVFANGPGDLGSIPGRVIPKTLKMELDTTLLNTQHYNVRFKGKVEQSREWSSALPYTLV